MKKQNTFPIVHFEDNLIFDVNGNCWGAFEMMCEEYNMLSENGKVAFVERLSRLIAQVGEEAKIFIIPVRQPLKESLQYELEQVNRGYKDKGAIYTYAKNYLLTTNEILEEGIVNGGGTNDYKVYILTKFKRVVDKFDAKFFLDNPLALIEEKIGFAREVKRIKTRHIEQYRLESERYQKTLNERFEIVPITSDTTQWLIGRIFLRGTIKEPSIDKGWEVEATLEEVDVKNRKGEVIEKEEYLNFNPYSIMQISNYRWKRDPDNKRVLRIEDEEGNYSYQRFLALSRMPKELVIPGDEWLSPLLSLKFGVEICISIKTKEFKKAEKEIEDNKTKIEGQDEHARQSGEVSNDDIEKAYRDTNSLEEELRVFNDPLVEFAVTIAVASTQKEKVRDHAKIIESCLESRQIQFNSPAQDVLRAFHEMIPGSPVGYLEYSFKTTPKVLATSVFPVAIESGDRVGHFIGTAGARGKYVFLSPSEAIRANRSAGIGVLGTLGGGKSVLANYLGYILTLLDGGRMLIIDPKSERDTLWKGYLREFESEIGVTKITYTDKGVFDPFVIYRPETLEWFERHKQEYAKVPGNSIVSYEEYCKERMSRAKDLANAMFTEELVLKDGSLRKLAFSEALDRAAATPNPSMERVIEILAGERYAIYEENDAATPDARLLAREMRQMQSNNRLANLMIGNGTEKGLSFSKKINIMQIQGLTIPDPNTAKEDYTVQQKTSATIMMPLGEFAREFTRDSLYFDVPKMVIFDEAWFLKSTSQGALLYSEVARTGRSLFSIPIFIGHSVKDVDEPGIRESLTYLFIFKMATETEAKASLKILGLEETKSNINKVMSLPNGHCLFKDLNGRVQLIRIDIPMGNLLKAFETNPERRSKLYDELRKEGRL